MKIIKKIVLLIILILVIVVGIYVIMGYNMYKKALEETPINVKINEIKSIDNYTTFDELPSKYDISDVSFTLLNVSLKNETGKELNENKDFISLELMTQDKMITNAGLLLSDPGLLV